MLHRVQPSIEYKNVPAFAGCVPHAVFLFRWLLTDVSFNIDTRVILVSEILGQSTITDLSWTRKAYLGKVSLSVKSDERGNIKLS